MTTVADTARSRCIRLLTEPVLDSLAPAIERALDRLDRPLVVAVTGHVSAGKSTLINALAGRPVTATGATETTLVSWWLRRGSEERVVVKRRADVPLVLDIGAELSAAEHDLDLDAVEPITVWLNSHLLDDLVLVDTPGLFSPNDERSARARELVHAQTGRASAGADAVVHVTAEAPGAKREAAELDAFAAGFPDLGHAPTNALIVMTKADRYWPASADPRATASAALDSARAAWRSRAWQAIPVAALLADARPDDGDLEILAALAARDPLDTAIRLLAARARSGRAPPAEAALLKRLGPYGIAIAARAIAAGTDPAAALHEASGIDEVRRAIDQMFRARTQTMRTDRMLRELEALAFGRDVTAAASACLRSAVDDVRAGQDGGGLRALLALRLAADPRVRLPDAARDEVRAVFATPTVAERAAVPPGAPAAAVSSATARERARWWRAMENMRPSAPDRRWLAAQVAAAYERIARE
ncbi:MAG TPA: dynamin family protein [Solirubrobacteraceae bacterium]|nr:dynamin family protein [Solirubrobacteraceae bacterium]